MNQRRDSAVDNGIIILCATDVTEIHKIHWYESKVFISAVYHT